MASIHVLDEKTINKIAAGEVVERPASVIKEVVENAIDAGATSIEIEIAEGGTAYMRISDNGCGMSEEDARLAIVRHATSKIRQVDDLFDIASLGFRGEALASISAVSRFTLTTRREEDSLGTRLTVDGGKLLDCTPQGCSIGTDVEIKDLFFNTPARKKFLKTTRTEGAKVQDMVGKLALSNTHIGFKLIVDQKISLVTPGNHSIGDTIAALYGYKVAQETLPVMYEGEGICIDGAVGKPSLTKSSRTWQTIIVNHRVVSDRMIMKAIDTAYHSLLPKGGYSFLVLSITVPPESIDINVHPRKAEVKFSDDKPVFSAIHRAILQGLQQAATTPVAVAAPVTYEETFGKRTGNYEILREPTFSREDTNTFVEQVRKGQYTPQKRVNYTESSLPFSDDALSFPRTYTEEDLQTFRTLSRSSDTPLQDDGSEISKTVNDASLLPIGQVASCFVLAKKNEDLYIIDQHAAHERIRYDVLCSSAEAIPSQELLIPMYMNGNEEELTIMEEEVETFHDLGFYLELGGPNKIKVTATPADFDEAQTEEIVQYILSVLLEGATLTKGKLRHEMLAFASCRGAIKSGHTLNMQQMNQLIKDLFATDNPYVCPHGRPTIIRFTPQELGKLFLRT